MKLRFLDGPETGRVVDISGGLTIGRDKSCDIIIDEDGVSRTHARVSRDGTGYVLEDMNSRNGVRVNGSRIEKNVMLKSQDRIGVGDRIILFTTDSAIFGSSELPKPKRPPAAVADLVPESDGMNGPVLAGLAVIVVAVVVFLVWQSGRPDTSVAVVTTTTTIRSAPPPPELPPRPPAPGPTIFVPNPQAEFGHYLVTTIPAGAAVEIAGRSVGLSPVLVRDISAGKHAVRISKAGYRPADRFIWIPQGKRSFDHPFELERTSGTCLLTSNPSGASVMLGNQFLGRTPYLMSGFQADEYGLKIVQFGFAVEARSVIISNHRATAVHTDLSPNLGSLKIVTLPSPARVFVDDQMYGISEPSETGDRRSRPMLVDGLRAEDHSIYMEYDGKESETRIVGVRSGRATTVGVSVWAPDTEIRTIDNKVFRGMLKRRNEHGDLLLSVSRIKDVPIVATRVMSVREITEEEYDNWHAMQQKKP